MLINKIIKVMFMSYTFKNNLKYMKTLPSEAQVTSRSSCKKETDLLWGRGGVSTGKFPPGSTKGLGPAKLATLGVGHSTCEAWRDGERARHSRQRG